MLVFGRALFLFADVRTSKLLLVEGRALAKSKEMDQDSCGITLRISTCCQQQVSTPTKPITHSVAAGSKNYTIIFCQAAETHEASKQQKHIEWYVPYGRPC